MSLAAWAKKRIGRRGRRLVRHLIEGLVWLTSWLPTHAMRVAGMRLFGAKIGPDVALGRGVRVLEPWRFTVGAHSMIGRKAYLDARGGLTIGSNCNISDDAAIWTAEHDVQSPDFVMTVAPVTVGDRAWLAYRSVVLPGVVIGEGAVVANAAVVTRDVAAFSLVAGVPAKEIGKRNKDLTYELGRHTL